MMGLDPLHGNPVQARGGRMILRPMMNGKPITPHIFLQREGDYCAKTALVCPCRVLLRSVCCVVMRGAEQTDRLGCPKHRWRACLAAMDLVNPPRNRGNPAR
jgi:hypothetical protein